MTAQASEYIIIDGDWYRFGDMVLPLDPILRDRRIEFERVTSACWRGYCGLWRLRHGRLHLLKLDRFDRPVRMKHKGTHVDIETLFPGQQAPIFASWWSGRITCRYGRRLEYVHVGFASVYEFERRLDFCEGVLVGDDIVERSAQSIE